MDFSIGEWILYGYQRITLGVRDAIGQEIRKVSQGSTPREECLSLSQFNTYWDKATKSLSRKIGTLILEKIKSSLTEIMYNKLN